MSEKYRISIPYRNREHNLNKIIPILKEKFKDSNFKIQVVEQSNDLPFNIAYLINIGFDIFKKQEQDLEWTYIFHPVDCYPIDVDYNIYDKDIVALCQHGSMWGNAYCYKPSSYIKMNGYSNNYWGWGGEDHEPNKKSKLFKLSLEKRGIDFDQTENKSDHNNITNNRNLATLSIKTFEDFIKDGLNTIKYDIVEKNTYDGYDFYKVDFDEEKRQIENDTYLKVIHSFIKEQYQISDIFNII
jgi:hypothetical protein